MVKTRHREKTILPVGWEPKDGRAEVEVLHLAELALRVPRAFERPEFHAFVVYTRGTSKHEIDFERIACRPGTLLHVRPGQVQRWHLREGVDGLALVFQPTLLASSAPSRASLASSAGDDLDLASWPTNVELGAIDLAAATDWLLRIERAATESRGAPRARALLRHLVSAALLDLARRPPFERAAQRLSSAVRVSLRRFEADIERSFRVTRTVGDYAARLGCSSRTLDRLARETSNVSAKRLIDARVILEARRLLAHTHWTVAAIGEHLGFEEPTNFVKFFKARTRESPGAFRKRSSR